MTEKAFFLNIPFPRYSLIFPIFTPQLQHNDSSCGLLQLKTIIYY